MLDALFILGLALLFLGPQKMAAMAAELGRWLAKARMFSEQFKQQLQSELAVETAPEPQPLLSSPGPGPEIAVNSSSGSASLPVLNPQPAGLPEGLVLAEVSVGEQEALSAGTTGNI